MELPARLLTAAAVLALEDPAFAEAGWAGFGGGPCAGAAGAGGGCWQVVHCIAFAPGWVVSVWFKVRLCCVLMLKLC